MKPTLPQGPPPGPDILPSLFLQQTHRDPRNFAASVLLHLCVAGVIAVALHHAVTNRVLIPPTPFTPIHLSEAVAFPSNRPGIRGETSGGSRHEATLASMGVAPPVVARPLMTPTTHVPDDPPPLVIPQAVSSSAMPVILKGAIGDPHGVLGP